MADFLTEQIGGAPSGETAQPQDFLSQQVGGAPVNATPWSDWEIAQHKRIGLPLDKGLTYAEWLKQDTAGTEEGRSNAARLMDIAGKGFSGIWESIKNVPSNISNLERDPTFPGGDGRWAKTAAIITGTGRAVLDSWDYMGRNFANVAMQGAENVGLVDAPPGLPGNSEEENRRLNHSIQDYLTHLEDLQTTGKQEQFFNEYLGFKKTVDRQVENPETGEQVTVKVNPAVELAGTASIFVDPTNYAIAGVGSAAKLSLGTLAKTSLVSRLANIPLRGALRAAEFVKAVPAAEKLVNGMRSAAAGVMLSPTGEILTKAGQVLSGSSRVAAVGLDKVGQVAARPAVRYGLGAGYLAWQALGDDGISAKDVTGVAAFGLLGGKVSKLSGVAAKGVVAGDLLKGAGAFAKLPVQEALAAASLNTLETLPGMPSSGLLTGQAKAAARWTASTGMPAAAVRWAGRNAAQFSDRAMHGVAMGGLFGFAMHGDAEGAAEGAGFGLGLSSTLGLGAQALGETAGRFYFNKKNLPSLGNLLKVRDTADVPAGFLVIGDSPGLIEGKQKLARQWLQSKPPAEQALFTRATADGKPELTWQDHYKAAFLDLVLAGARGRDGQDFGVRWLGSEGYTKALQSMTRYQEPDGTVRTLTDAEAKQRAELGPWVTLPDPSTGRQTLLLNMDTHGGALFGIDRAFHEAHHALSLLRGADQEPAKMKALKSFEKQLAENYGPNWTRASISESDRLQHSALAGDPMGMALAKFHNSMFGEKGPFGTEEAKGMLYDQYQRSMGKKNGEFPAWKDLPDATRSSLTPSLATALDQVFQEGGAESLSSLMSRAGTNPIDFIGRAATGTPASVGNALLYYHGGMLGTFERGLNAVGIKVDGVNAGAAVGNRGSLIFRNADGTPFEQGDAVERSLAQFLRVKMEHLDRMRMTDSFDESAKPTAEVKLQDVIDKPDSAPEVLNSGLVDEQHFRETMKVEQDKADAKATAEAQAAEVEQAKAEGRPPEVVQPVKAETVPVPPEAIKPTTPEKVKEQQVERDRAIRDAVLRVQEPSADPRAVAIDPDNGRHVGVYLTPEQMAQVLGSTYPGLTDAHKASISILNEALWAAYDPTRGLEPPPPLQVLYYPAQQAGLRGKGKGKYNSASVNAKSYLVSPFGFKEAADGQWTAQMFDVAGWEADAAREFGVKDSRYVQQFGTLENFRAKNQQVFENYRKGKPGASSGVTTAERDAVNAFLGFPKSVVPEVNPQSYANKQNRFLRSMRIDRIASVMPGDGMPMPVDYRSSAANYSPQVSWLGEGGPERQRAQFEMSIFAGDRLPGFAAVKARSDELLKAGDVQGAQKMFDDMNDRATESIQAMMQGLDVTLTPQKATGAWMGDVEPSLRVDVEFNPGDEAAVQRSLAQFGQAFRQQNVLMVDKLFNAGPETVFGSTGEPGTSLQPAVTMELASPLDLASFNAIVTESGASGATLSRNGTELFLHLMDTNGDQSYATATQQATKLAEALDARGVSPKTYLHTVRVRSFGSADWGATGDFIDYRQAAGDGYDVAAASGKARPVDRIRTEAASALSAILGEKITLPAKASFERKPEDTARQYVTANYYEGLPVIDGEGSQALHPDTHRAYEALVGELDKQMRSLNVRLEFMPKDANGNYTDVYGSMPSRVLKDMEQNNRLFVYPTTEETFGPASMPPDTRKAILDNHPLYKDSPFKTESGKPMKWNDVLRGVHDAIAHGAYGAQFGENGEELAFLTHAMITRDPWAIWALATETRGQNSWVNFGPQMRDPQSGQLMGKSDPRYLQRPDRGFAVQKTGLLPIGETRTGLPEVDQRISDLRKELEPERQMGSYRGKVKPEAYQQPKVPSFTVQD